MNLHYNATELRKKVAKLSLSPRDSYLSHEDIREYMCLVILFGGINHTREFSPEDKPFPCEKIEGYKEQMWELLYQMKKDLNIDPNIALKRIQEEGKLVKRD